LGKFEVKLKRVVDGEGRKGEVLEVYTPIDSIGNIQWGGRLSSQVKGGRIRVARMLDSPEVGWIELTDPAWANMSEEEYLSSHPQDWWKSAEGPLVPDPEWAEPAHEQRPAGVVDWDALEKNYKIPPPAGVEITHHHK